MKPEEFKQNVKDRVRVFEDGGIRLLKKGKRGIIRAIFGRTGLVLALFFVQVLLLFSVFRWFTALVPHLLGGSIAFTAVMVIYLLNSDMDNSAKITWLVVIALVPVLGVVLFWWTKGEVGHRMLKRRLKQLEQDTRGATAPGCPNAGTAESTGVGCGLAGLLPAGERRRLPGV